MWHAALVEMERAVVACGGGDVGHLSLVRLPPTIIHASILSLSFFILILLSSILRYPLASLFCLFSSFVFLSFFTLTSHH